VSGSSKCLTSYAIINFLDFQPEFHRRLKATTSVPVYRNRRTEPPADQGGDRRSSGTSGASAAAGVLGLGSAVVAFRPAAK